MEPVVKQFFKKKGISLLVFYTRFLKTKTLNNIFLLESERIFCFVVFCCRDFVKNLQRRTTPNRLRVFRKYGNDMKFPKQILFHRQQDFPDVLFSYQRRKMTLVFYKGGKLKRLSYITTITVSKIVVYSLR